jgi:cyclomaltodextrinase
MIRLHSVTSHRFVRAWIACMLPLAACSDDSSSDPIDARAPIDASSDASPADAGPDCVANPLGDTPIYLRGSFNSWVAEDSRRFTYDCTRFVLSTEIIGSFDFKIADANWTAPTTFGGGAQGTGVELGTPIVVSNAEAGPNLSLIGTGLMTFTLDVSQSKDTPLLLVSEGSGGPNIGDNEIAKSLRFDSRSLAYKTPFGAINPGATVMFTIEAQAGSLSAIDLVVEEESLYENQYTITYTAVATVPMVHAGTTDDGSKDRWQASFTFEKSAVYGYYFQTTIDGASVIYANNNITIPYTRSVGAGGVGQPYYKPMQSDAIRRFRQTVYDPAFAPPDWAKDAVYYYIFPERFRNGDPTNDPTPGEDTYVGNIPVEVHASWIDDGPWVPGMVDGYDGDDEHYNNDFYGGDLQGIIDQLDYIAGLGANTLYINPVFEAPSNHKYDTADYLHIDDNFGDDAVFDTLVAEANERNIRIILDTSLNHCAADSVYMDRYGKYPEQVGAFEDEMIRMDSPFYEWFEFNPTATDPDLMYNSWLGISTLANLAETDAWKAFAFGNTDSVTRTWLQRGVAGWRMDVAPWVEDDFWREWRVAVKETNPEALALAETWFDSSKFFLGDTFDSTMNYIFRDAVFAFARGEDATRAMEILELTREHYPPAVYHSLMNLLSTHDAPRALFQFGYDVGDTSFPIIAVAKQKLRLAVLFQMTYPGAPTIFYGDEVGLTGAHDPFNRRTYPWADQGGSPDGELLEDITALVQMRNQNPVLRRGSLEPLYSDAHVIVMLRKLDNVTAIVAVNNHDSDLVVTVDLTGHGVSGTLEDLVGNRDSIEITGNSVELKVPALFGNVYVSAEP